MKYLARRDDRGYLDSYLWLPLRGAGSTDHVRNGLTFVESPTKVVEAWSAAPGHLLVPRNYIDTENFSKLPFPVIDARFRTFPKIKVKSKVVLDFKDPSRTVQRDASAALLAHHDCVISLACGIGKTPTALHSWAQLGTPAIVVVNEKSLAFQWIEEILAFTDVRRDEIGFVGEGTFDWVGKKIVLALVQTLAAKAVDGTLPPEMLTYFGLIIGDEAHVLAAPYFNRAVPAFHGRRWGLSATPFRGDVYEPLLRYTFGPVVYSFLIPDLEAKCVFRRLPTRVFLSKKEERDLIVDVNGDEHLFKLYGFLATNRPERVEAIVEDANQALAKNRQLLILTHSREMCEQLGALLPGSGVVHGGVKGEERIRRIRECNPVIAIIQVGKQALNKPELDTLLLSEPTTKPNVLQQIVGRILRKKKGTNKPLFIIYEDRYIPMLAEMCGKIRRVFNKWPAAKGGVIKYEVIG